MRTPYIPLAGVTDVEVLLKGRDAKFRANLRRRMRKLRERGELRLRRHEEADASVLQRFYELEQAGWKGRAGTAIACDPSTRRFYDEAARWASEQGCLAVYALELEGTPIAMQWGLEQNGRYFLPKPAYDPTYASHSPGQILMHEVLADLCRRGVAEFDFLGPWMDWKADWTSQVRVHNWCYVFGKGALGRLSYLAKFGLRSRLDTLRRKVHP
jgi:CelD/BcsL family acetyltransferase involved in cellulose biosynthesis